MLGPKILDPIDILQYIYIFLGLYRKQSHACLKQREGWVNDDGIDTFW